MCHWKTGQDRTTTMKFDKIIQRLLPHDESFYKFFDEASQNLVNAVALLKELSVAKQPTERDRLVMQIKELEHHGDSLTHMIFSELNSTFVTPFDREDIHQLTSALDDVLDHMDGTANRISLYKIKKYPKSMVQLVDILQLSIAELHRGVGMLRDLNKTNELQRVFQKVNEYENNADTVFEQGVADLFEKEKSAIQVIKLKEILVGLETATDKCEDAANVLEGIYIKNA
jgi:predicted phosphate transport protein (TIGR00153 family)